jgi:CPA1 family monovalent cation:H+ antiporter
VGHDWLGTLEEVPLFAGLSKRHLRRIAKLAHIRRFAPGSVMVRTGDTGRSFYVLLDGSAKVTRSGRRPQRHEAGAFFGEMALFTGEPRTANIVAIEETEVLEIGHAAMKQVFDTNPDLVESLSYVIAERRQGLQASADLGSQQANESAGILTSIKRFFGMK